MKYCGCNAYMEENKNIESIILHYVQGDIAEDEMKVLMAWVKENEENKTLFFQVKNNYEMRPGGLMPTKDELLESKDRLLEKIRKEEEKERIAQSELHRRTKRISLYKYVAVAVVCICCTLGAQYLLTRNTAPLYTELDMESGPRMGHMTLPDGTKVVLNASTKLRFPDKFEKDQRNVYLDGEAYFDVVKNAKAPFIVHTDKQKITVLGTQFNVMDYADDDYAITTLVSGKVKMQTANEEGKYGEAVILKPSQQLFFNRQTKQLALSTVKLDMSRTWVNKVYHFKEEPLIQITSRLEKLYGVKIHIQNEELKNAQCTGTFGLEQELEEVLRIINFEKLFTYKTVDEEIYIE